VRYGEGAAKMEGAPLTKFVTTLNEYLSFFDKVDKRVRRENVTELLPRFDLSKREDFEGEADKPPKKIAQLEKQLKALAKQAGFKSVESKFETEHTLWEVHFTDAQGAERVINWEMASSPEYRQMISKYKQIEAYMEPPFVVQSVLRTAPATNGDEAESDAERSEREKAARKTPKAAKSKEREEVEMQTARELFDYVLNEGRKDYTVQRYKGLGEMSAGQLWETTMDPERRTLLEVKLEDIAECEAIFTTLMGEDVEARRKFIEDNALDVKNLDI
jgi:DNA gyrase subunit B